MFRTAKIRNVSVKTTLCYCPKKLIGCPFSHFIWKSRCSDAQILSKKRPFSKNHNALMPIFCQKIVTSLKNTPISCHFFKIFHKKPNAVISNLVNKRSILSELHYILRATKVIGCPVFPIFYEKNPCIDANIL